MRTGSSYLESLVGADAYRYSAVISLFTPTCIRYAVSYV